MQTPPRRQPSTVTVRTLLATALTLGCCLQPLLAQPDGKPEGKSGGKPAGPPPALVRVAPVTMQTLQKRWDLIGQLKEVNRVIVSTEQPGRLVAVKIDVGQPVVGGQTVLVRVEDTYAKLELAEAKAATVEAEATVKEAEALLANAQRERKYQQDLRGSGAGQRKELDDAITTEAAAVARLEAAKAHVLVTQARVDRANTSLKNLTVVAPFDGVVVRKLAERGQWSQQGTPVTEIISRGTIDAVIDVPERLIGFVQAGQEIELIVEPLKIETTGKVVAIIPQGSQAARTFPVKIRTEDQNGRLMPGMSVLAKLPTNQKAPALTVPRDAVLRSANGIHIWTNNNGKAMRYEVDILFGAGDRYAVRARPAAGPPLKAGDSVIIEGAERLRFPGQSLIVQNGGPPKDKPVEGGSVSQP